MVTELAKFSWKGLESNLWKGMTRLTPASHGEGRLRMIRNGYLSPDGTEIRQFPGFKCVVNLVATGYPGTVNFPATDIGYTSQVIDFQDDVAVPAVSVKTFTRPVKLHAFEVCRGRLLIIGESDFTKWYVTNTSGVGIIFTDTFQNGANTELTFTASVSTNVVSPGVTLYIQNTGNPLLDDQTHIVSVVAGAIVTITTSTVGATSGLTGHAYAIRGGYATTEPDALTVYTVDRKPDPATPTTTCWPATVANRIRDWGITRQTGSYAQPQTTHSYPREGWAGIEFHGVPRRKQRKLPYRVSPVVSGDRVLMAVRGYGVVFQAPVIIPPSTDPALGLTTIQHNHIYDRPRALGLPKAVMLDATDKTGMMPSTDVNYTFFQEQGTFLFQVVYRDSGTDEVGLPSETISITVNAAAKRIRLYILHPGYLLSECMPNLIDIYASAKGGVVLGYLTSVRVPITGLLGATAGFAEQLYEINLFGFTATEIDFTRTPAADVQMPMGCNAVHTIRGVTLFGGTFGNLGATGSLEQGEITYYPNQGASWSDADEIIIQTLNGNAAAIQVPWNVANPMLPPGYVGLSIFSTAAFPEEVKIVLFNLLKNTDAVFSAGTYLTPNKWFPRISVKEKPSILGVTTVFTSTPKAAILFLPRGLYWWSEAGDPPKVPAINQGFLDADANDDIEAVGRYRNYAIILTRRQTFRLQWGQRLRQEDPPQLLDPREGCISANSVVEADDFLGWMSDRGPYGIVGGGTRWIGAPLKPYFEGASPRYRRDSQGMMIHSWSAYDPERNLVYFGVRVADGGYAVEIDGEKSKFPCDEVLIYSLSQDAWSVWVPPLPIMWMRRALCLDGVNRMCFLANDNRIYALDDNWADTNASPISATAASSTTSPTFVASAASFNHTANPFQDGNAARAGMAYALYAAFDGRLIGKGVLLSVANTTTVVMDQTLTWKSGDILLVGILPPLEIETNSEAYGIARTEKIGAITIRYSTFKSHRAWAEVLSRGSRTTGTVNLSRGEEEDSKYNRIANIADPEIVDQQRYSRGQTRGEENNFILKVYGGPQVRISNVTSEVGE